MLTTKKLLLAMALVMGWDHHVDAKRLHKDNFSPAVPQRYISNIMNMFMSKDRLGTQSLRTSDSAFPYLTDASKEQPLSIAKNFLNEQLQLNEKDYVVKNAYTSKHNGVTHVYMKQVVDGMEVENGDFNVNVDKYGRVVSYGDSFHKGKKSVMEAHRDKHQMVFGVTEVTEEHASTTAGPWISAADAVKSFARYMNLPVPEENRIVTKTSQSINGEQETMVLGFQFVVSNGIPAKQKFLQQVRADGTTFLVPVWDIQTEMEENWYHAHISAKTGEVLGLMDWVSDASYEVFPIGVNDPEDGERVVVVDPADKDASPLGWHSQSKDDPAKQFKTTMGNNVYAQENLDGKSDGYINNYRPSGGDELKFEFPVNFTQGPETYLDAAVTNLFYWNNIMHDLFHKYGFDEESGNFQENNFGRGGRENDAVIANAQDGSGYNNANFATPPDGMNGKMRMYVWNTKTPYRDGDLEAGIIIHEYAHGISTRLTGGPANSGCLGWGEAGGMGEGWGDFFATALRMRPEYTREMSFPMGAYSMGDKKGIRKFIYSTDLSTNPSTYAFIKKFAYIGVHAKGEVWAAMLYELYWNLVDKHGFSKEWFDSKGKAGNQIALQLVVDGMKFQPCRPSFVDARDAILQADETNYDGENTCEIWKAFAKRGLGAGARSGGHESFELPNECQ